MKRLEFLVLTRVERVEQWLRERRDGGPGAVQQQTVFGGGRQAMDAALRMVAGTESDERGKLVAMDKAARSAQLVEVLLSALALIVALACFSATFASYRREYRRRVAVDGQLRNTNEGLEQRIHERTASLAKANEHLKAKVDELSEAEEEVRRLLATAEQGRHALLSVVEDHQQAEAALRRSEAYYRSTIESASDGIFINDALGNFLDANRYGCRMFGYTREELLALTTADVLAPEDRPRLATEIAGLSIGQVIRSVDRLFQHKDGTRFSGDLSATCCPTADCSPSCVTAPNAYGMQHSFDGPTSACRRSRIACWTSRSRNGGSWPASYTTRSARP